MIYNPFDLKIGKRFYPVFIKLEYRNGYMSFTGVEGPLKSGNAHGSCGQIDMHYPHRTPADNDALYGTPTPLEDMRFNPGWDLEKWYNLLDLWKKYHLGKEFVSIAEPVSTRIPAWC